MPLTDTNIKDILNLRKSSNNDDVFISNLLEHLKSEYKKDPTRSSKMSMFKKYVRDNNLLSDIYNINKIGDEKLRLELNKIRENKQEPDKQKLDQKVLDKIMSFENSTNPDEILIFLLFVTGRRISEFLNGNWFIKNGKLYIDKLNKKRGKIQDGGYEITTAKITPTRFLSLLGAFKIKNARNTVEANRKALDRIFKNNPKIYRPIVRVKDLRPLYIQYLRKYDDLISQKNSNQAIKNLLHHTFKKTSIAYNDKFEIVKTLGESDIKKMNKNKLKELLNGKGLNKKNTKGFNSLKKSQLIQLIVERGLNYL